MAVTAADLVAPKGELESSLFKGEDIVADGGRLDQYIAEAVAKGAASDEAVKAWAYHRTYLAVYLRMSSAPVKASLDDQGSREYDSKQAERFLARSNEMLNRYLDLTGGEAEAAPLQRGQTGAVSTQILWS